MVNVNLSNIRDLIRRSSLGSRVESHSSAELIDVVITRADEIVVEARSMGTAEHEDLTDHVILRSAAVFDLLAPRTPAVPVQVELRYDTRDPFAVVAAFRTGSVRWVEWTFSRDLLADGLLTETGEGDVRIRPATGNPEVVVVELSSPSGHALFEAGAQRLADFLDTTYDIVLPGHETVWIDLGEALNPLSFVMLAVDRDGPEGS